VVAEASKVTSLGCVDKLTLRERHEVEVLDAFFVILLHAPPEDIFANDLADILKDEVISFEILVSTQAVAFLLCLDDCNVCELFTEEALILTSRSASAISDALHFGGAVDTV